MPRRSRGFAQRHPGSRLRPDRPARPHDPAPPERAPHLADRRRGVIGAADRGRCRRRFPQRRRRRRRAGCAAGAALPRRAGGRAGKAARDPQPRRRRQRDLDRRRRRTRSSLSIPAPATRLIDDWVRRHTGQAADFDGALARAGRVSEAHVARFLRHPYFARTPPKSLDRDDFRDAAPRRPVGRRRRRHLDRADRGGGGGRGAALSGAAARMAGVRRRPAQPGNHGGAGAAGSAECRSARSRRSAGMATRSKRRPSPIWRCALRGLPLSLPTTTGAPQPVCGGRLFPAAAASPARRTSRPA